MPRRRRLWAVLASGALVFLVAIAGPAVASRSPERSSQQGRLLATVAPMAAFTCSVPTILLSQGEPTELYGGVPSAGVISFSKIGTTSGWIYNAIGYDTATNYLYGVSLLGSSRYPSGHLLEIASTGAVSNLGEISGDSYLTDYGATNGAFDTSGNFWVTTGGAPDVDEVDVSTHTVVKKLAITPAKTWLASDLTYADGYMWGMELGAKSTVEVERLDLANGDVSTFKAPASIKASNTYGAAWTFGNGDLGFQSNSSGEIFELAVTSPSSAAPSFTLLATYNGPVAGANNDGAACAPKTADVGIVQQGPTRAVAGTEIAWSLTLENHGPGISSGYVVEDDVPAAVTKVESPSPGCTVAGNAVKCSEGELAVDARHALEITGTAPAAGTCLTDTASVIGNEATTKPDPYPTTSSVETCAVNPCSPTQAQAACSITAVATVHAGSLFVTTPALLSWSRTLTGDTAAFDAPADLGWLDASGLISGWRLTVAATRFTNGVASLPATALSLNGSRLSSVTTSPPTASCAAESSCSASGLVSGTVAYPLVVPAGEGSPLPVELYGSPGGAGRGALELLSDWWLTIPDSAPTGTYLDTIELAIVSGP
jgi:hypothetical protein